MMKEETPFQCHRGYWLEGETENTMGALRAARIKGYSMVEFDVRLTRDYVPVLYHDETLNRLHQVPISVKSLTLEQLTRFVPDITTLESVLLSPEVPEFLNIELKTRDLVDPALEIQVTRLVSRHKAQDRVVFSSFNPLSLIRAKSLNPEIARALLVSPNDDEGNHRILREMKLRTLCRARFLHLDHRMMDQALVLDLLEEGFKIAAYTVNDEKKAELLFSWGVQSIISDKLL